MIMKIFIIKCERKIVKSYIYFFVPFSILMMCSKTIEILFFFMKSNFLTSFLYSLFKIITEGTFNLQIDTRSKSISLSLYPPILIHPKQIRSVNFAIFKTSFNCGFFDNKNNSPNGNFMVFSNALKSHSDITTSRTTKIRLEEYYFKFFDTISKIMINPILVN